MILADTLELPGTSYGFEYDKMKNCFLLCFANSSNVYIVTLKNNYFVYNHTVDLSDFNISPKAIKISSKREIFITCAINRCIFVFNDEFKFLRKIRNTAEDCCSIEISDERNEVYVSSNNDNVIQKFDALSGALIDEYKIPRPWKIALKNDKLYTSCLGSLMVIDSKDGSVIENILIEKDTESNEIYVDDDNNILVIMNNQCNKESKYLYTIKKVKNNNYSIDKLYLCEAQRVSEMIKIGEDLFLLTHEEECDFYLHRLSL